MVRGRRQAPETGMRTAAPARRGAPSTRRTDAVLDLQHTAGNDAVVDLLTSVQRAPAAGWANAAVDQQGTSWNAAEVKNVANTGITRYPLDGLTEGNQQAYATDYPLIKNGKPVLDPKTGQQVMVRVNAGEKRRTSESAAGRAIALVPSTLKPSSPVDVMVHLHGFTGRSSDPYAGWRQQTVGTGGRLPPGRKVGEATVRDVDWDRIPQQMADSGNTQLIAILPQGVGRSEFGRFRQKPFIDEVMARLQAVVPWPAVPKDVRVVMSAHSGGGNTVTRMLGAKGGLPASVGTVMLFEAINSWGQAETVWTWVHAELERLAGSVSSGGGAASKDKDALVAAAPRLRAYCSKATAGYAVWHRRLKKAIEQWFVGQVPSNFSKDTWQSRKGGPPQLGTYADPMKSLFQVQVDLPGDHETVIRDNLRDALGALPRAGAPTPAGGAGGSTPPGGSAGTTSSSAVGTSAVGPSSAAATPASLGLTVLAALVGHDEKTLTNTLFFLRHPELGGRRIRREENALAREWLDIRDTSVRPFIEGVRTAGGGDATSTAGASGRAGGGTPKPVPDMDAGGPKPSDTGATSGTTVTEPSKEAVSEADRKGIAAATRQALTGGKEEDVAALATALEDNDTTVEQWFAGHEPSATFLGLGIKPSGGKTGGVHRELAAALRRAEADLLGQYPGATPAEVAKQLGVYEIKGLRPPKKATGGTLPSYHCFGLAVDINYAGNPFVGQTGGRNKAAGDAAADVVRYATLLLTGTAANIRQRP
ncbi:MAG TPA: M15 family metallopeptidase, partial [Euzebyales bacterium]|nr:M15 family metallopeptidase [Euzebyales bacterium]